MYAHQFEKLAFWSFGQILRRYEQNRVISLIIKRVTQKEEKILIVVGAEKVPREIFEKADYNISIGTQPHSEISALAILLDRIQKGQQFDKKFSGSKRVIIPSKNGKNVQVHK